MNEIPYRKKINPKVKAIVTIFALIIIGIITWIYHFDIQSSNNYCRIKQTPYTNRSCTNQSISSITILVCLVCMDIEITFLIGLLYVYYDSYRKTKSRFLIGLNMFIIALLIRSFLSVISLYTIATDYIQVIPYVSRTFLTPGFGELNFILSFLRSLHLVSSCISVWNSHEICFYFGNQLERNLIYQKLSYFNNQL